MHNRKFGETGWDASMLGLGCMRLPTTDDELNSPNVDESKAIELIRYAIDHGVNYLDSGQMYHQGNSERVIGKALTGEYRDKAKLATKMWHNYVEKSDDLNRLFDEQIERLQIDCIDLYLLHGLDAKSWHKLCDLGVREWAEKLLADDRIGHFGFSFHGSFEDFREIVDDYDAWAFCQIQYNFVDVAPQNQAGVQGLRYAASKGLPVVVMEPLLGGNLAGTPGRVKEIWDSAVRKCTPADWALQWLWNQPEVTVALSGMTTIEEVKQNIACAEVSSAGMLTQEDLALFDEVRAEYERLRPVPCTQCSYCMPCPNEVNIPRIFGLFNTACAYGNVDRCRKAYARFLPEPTRAGACTQCRECEEKCPQSIPISEWMPKVHAVLTEGKEPEQVL